MEKVRDIWWREWSEFLVPGLLEPESSDLLPWQVPSLLADRKVLLNPAFIQRIVAQGANEEIAISTALARAINRFLRIPRDFGIALQMYAALREAICDPELARRFLETYLTIVNDMDLAAHRGFASELSHLYRVSAKALPPPPPTPDVLDPFRYYRIVASLLQVRWGIDLGLDLVDEFWKSLVEELNQLEYLHATDPIDDVSQFGSILQRFGFCLGESKTAPDEEPPTVWPVEETMWQSLPEVSVGIVDFIEEHGTQGWIILEELTRTAHGHCLLRSRWLFYDLKTHLTRLTIEPRPIPRHDRIYPVSLREWEPCDGIQNLAPHSSFGGKLAFPYLTKQWLLVGQESNYYEPDLPSLLVIIDSSGSMIDANLHESPAVVAATAAANVYLEHGQRVGVYNFSNEDLVLESTTNRSSVLRYLAAYQGGGTNLNPDAVQKLLHSSNGDEVDILIISDLGFGNWDATIQVIAKCADIHRVWVIATGSLPSALDTFRTALGSKVECLKIERPEDIPQIVLGAIKRSWTGKYGNY